MTTSTKPTPAPPATEHEFASREILHTLQLTIEAARDGNAPALAATLAQVVLAFTEFSAATKPQTPADPAEVLRSLPVEDLINELTRRVHDEGTGTPYALMIHELAHARIVEPSMAPILSKACSHYAIDAKRQRDDKRDAQIEDDVATAAEDFDDAPSMEDGWTR